MLIVTVIEAQGVEFEQSIVSVTVNDHPETTYQADGNIPQFNSQFRFLGANISDSISIVLNDFTNSSNRLTGVQSIKELGDQKIHDKWIAVRHNQNSLGDTKIHLQFKYTFSKSKLCAEAIENWRQHISSLQLKNEKSLNDLRQMYQGFDFLETIKQKPNYFADIKPIDKIGHEVNSKGYK